MIEDIFHIKSETDFQQKCLETFRYQYQNIEVYRKFCDYLKINTNEIDEVEKIPFLPIETFKNHLVLDKVFDFAQTDKPVNFFQSSGTSQIQNRSKHFVANFSLYEESIYKSFEQFIGKPEDFIFIGLLPNYSENPHSSLIYMVNFLMKKSGKPENGYFLYNHKELLELLNKLNDKKVILFGVSFALLDFLDFLHSNAQTLKFSNALTIIETGGMKGRKEEVTKDELLKIFKKGFGTERIFSEYSMTELLSQAYSLGENIYETPNWMRVLIRNAEDPFSYVEDGRNGAINIIDLANRHSCSFIATQDLGRIINNPEILRDAQNDKNDFEVPRFARNDDNDLFLELENARNDKEKFGFEDESVKMLREPQHGKTPIQNKRFQVLGRIDHSDIRGCSLLVS